MPDNASVVHETELNAKEEMITKLQSTLDDKGQHIKTLEKKNMANLKNHERKARKARKARRS